jgi:putative peptidoglycan lipid II flippase
MDGERGLVRAAGSVGAMTALSRVLGYVRDALEGAILGTSLSMDAFVIAYRIPNLLRRLVAEGALTSAFVPTFARYMSRDRQATWRFAASVLYALSLLLVAIVVVGIVFSPLWVNLLAWNWGTSQPDKFDLTVALNRLMWPYILFISLAALAAGILNSFEVYALPAFTPVLLNLAIISCGVGLRGRFSDPAYGFAVGVLVGGILQLAIQVPPVLRRGLSLRPPRPIDWEGLREVRRLILPRIFGAGITQINLVVDSQFAAALASGSVAILYYGSRVTELALGVFAISLSTVMLPRLSRAAAAGDRAQVRDTLSLSLRLLLFITVPATLGLIILRVPIVHVLFERGKFTPADTRLTSGAMGYYAVGLLAYAAVSVLAAAFYAHRDTRTPVVVATWTFFVHLGLNFTLRGPMAHNGIALSTSLTAFLDALLLLLLLPRHAGPFLDRALAASAARTLTAGALMAAALLTALRWVDVPALPGLGVKAAALAALVAGGGGIYLAVSLLLGGREVRLIGSMLGRPR